jgi:hypothetical protein
MVSRSRRVAAGRCGRHRQGYGDAQQRVHHGQRGPRRPTGGELDNKINEPGCSSSAIGALAFPNLRVAPVSNPVLPLTSRNLLTVRPAGGSVPPGRFHSRIFTVAPSLQRIQVASGSSAECRTRTST